MSVVSHQSVLSLASLHLHLELDGRQLAADFGRHDRVHAEVGEGAAHEAAAEDNELGGALQVLLRLRHLGQELEVVVLENVDTLERNFHEMLGVEHSVSSFMTNLVIGAEVVDLLAEDGHPEVLADELHEVQLILELRTLLGQLLDEAVTGVEPDELEVGERLLPLLGVGLLENLAD